MDNIIIEHLACLEINNYILKPPFHLISNVNWNDKSISFDGDIEVYKETINKINFEGRVPIQVKGTTKVKKGSHKKMKFGVKKQDLDVYYKDGNGVLYFVVTINAETMRKQIYYKMLAPLDLKGYLGKLAQNGKDSIVISFKKLEENQLENICKRFMKLVESQPKKFINSDIEKHYESYKLQYNHLNDGRVDFFDEFGYLYGVSNNQEIPISAVEVRQIKGSINENIDINNVEKNIDYEIIETPKKYIINIENTLKYEIIKNKSRFSISLNKIISVESYLNCLYLIKYQIENRSLPFQGFNITVNNGDSLNDFFNDFTGIEEMIENLQRISEIFKIIGLSSELFFNKDENVNSLFSGLIEIFEYKNYGHLNIKNGATLQELMIYDIALSDFINVKLIFTDEGFLDFYSEETLAKLGGLLPRNPDQKIEEYNSSDWDLYYFKVSIYSSQSIEEMHFSTNFKFEVLEKSFDEKYHDILSDVTIDCVVKFVKYFEESLDERYLDLAFDLTTRYIEKSPNSYIGMINYYIIKNYQKQDLLENEINNILDISENIKKSDTKLKFACEVLLKNKHNARRIFEYMNHSDQEEMREYPIFSLFSKL